MLLPTSTTPRKVPAQARSRATVKAIVQAAAQVLEREGIQALTTKRIAEVAGVSIGSLYQYFPGKQAVVVALIERQLELDRAAAIALLDAHSELALDLRLQHVAAGMCLHQARLAPLLSQLLPQLDTLEQVPVVEAWAQELDQAFMRLLQDHQEELRPELRSKPRLQMALELVTRSIRQALNHACLHDPERLHDPVFHREIARLSRGLLAD